MKARQLTKEEDLIGKTILSVFQYGTELHLGLDENCYITFCISDMGSGFDSKLTIGISDYGLTDDDKAALRLGLVSKEEHEDAIRAIEKKEEEDRLRWKAEQEKTEREHFLKLKEKYG